MRTLAVFLASAAVSTAGVLGVQSYTASEVTRAYEPMEADFDIPATAEDLVSMSQAEDIVRGTITDVTDGWTYMPDGPDGDPRANLTTIYFHLKVAESTNGDYAVGDTIQIEVFGGPSNDPENLALPTQQLTFAVRSDFLPASIAREPLTNFDDEAQVAAAGLSNGLYIHDGGVESLLSGEVGIVDSGADTASAVFAELEGALEDETVAN